MLGGSALEVSIESKEFVSPDGRSRRVLQDVRFAARPGEILALFGSSGIGKSTTLRIVLGLDRDFTGEVRRPAGRIGAVFQEPRLVPWLNVDDNLRLVLARDAPQADIPALLDKVGLAGREHRFPRELSLGMARRVALARALAVNPALLVLDEPFVSLDPLLSAKLATLVGQRARECNTLVALATHDLDQALGAADRLLVLSGDPASLTEDRRVPDRTDTSGIAAFRAELLTRFPFFGLSGAERPDPA